VPHRTAGEGPVGASILGRGTSHGHGGVCAALVELNWEMDFVARNADASHTAAFLTEPESSAAGSYIHRVPRTQRIDAPLLSAAEGPTPSPAASSARQGPPSLP